MRQSGTRSRHFPDPGLRIRTARGARAPRRRRCQPERASPGIRTFSRWVADPLEDWRSSRDHRHDAAPLAGIAPLQIS